ncbi:hypothetical protein MASR2M79_05880 [Aminivibrio sp.]
MIYLLSWYAQDFLQVLGTGTALVPEVFLLTLVVLSVFRPEKGPEILWAAFFGGVLWDLRWVGFPGITSLLYGITLTAVQLFWNSLPVSGRTVPLFGASLLGASIPIALTRNLLSRYREGASSPPGCSSRAICSPHSPCLRPLRLEAEEQRCLT